MASKTSALAPALGAGAFGLDRVEEGGQRLRQAAAGGGAGEDRAGDDGRVGAVAVELDRLRQAELPGERRDDRRVDEL